MIGIICAMQIEAETLLSRMENVQKKKLGKLEFTSGRLEGVDVALGMAGVGKVNAAMCAEAMILTYAPELIINSGVAGSLSGKFSILDIAVGERVVQHDFDTTATGDPPAYFLEYDCQYFPCDADAMRSILQAAEACGVRANPATIASGDQFISDKADKERIVTTFGGEVCEMEAGAIAEVALANGVKCAVIRAISDSTDGAHQMEFYEFLPRAAEASANVLLEFLRRKASGE